MNHMAIDDQALTFEEITEEDVPELTDVMTRAFDDDAQKHLGKERGGPEGYDSGEFFRQWLFAYQESIGYKIIYAGKVVGGIIVWILPEDHNILGTIFVDPAFQDKGIGERTWAFIEDTYPQTTSWRLATPTWATKNHHFYAKCGFSQVESDPLIPEEEDITIYRKGTSML
jgi:GNAT superfamily N-acetyltransferase